MIKELVDYADRIRRTQAAEGAVVHDAIKKELVHMIIQIDGAGRFQGFMKLEEPRLSDCEALSAKKGKARLLVDKLEETLGCGIFDPKASGKHIRYLEKLQQYSAVETIEPIIKFFKENARAGKNQALKELEGNIQAEIEQEYVQAVSKASAKGKLSASEQKKLEEAAKTKTSKKYQGNIAFMLNGKFLNENPDVLAALKEHFGKSLERFGARVCSVCNRKEYPVEDIPHGMIKRVPDGQSSGSALVSFNASAFESYALTGNLNSQICTNCGRAYVDALNFLLAPSGVAPDAKGKEKPFFNHRCDFGNDTACVFWTREEAAFNPFRLLETANEAELKGLLQSVQKGSKARVQANDFYAITLSGAAARIMVRDYIHSSVEEIQQNLLAWFEDIDTGQKDGGGKTLYSPLWRMAEATRRPNDSKRNDVTPARVQSLLCRAALYNLPIPIWVLQATLQRLRMESYQLKANKQAQGLSYGQVFSPARMATLKLVINRLQQGEQIMKDLNTESKDVAYICGQVFAVLAKIQYHAARRDLNVGVVSRFYSAASTTPGSAFGRLFKNAQHHLAKIGGSNKGLAVNLEKECSALMEKVGPTLPSILSLEQQARFALGFYQQRNQDFKKREIDVDDEQDEENE